MMLFGSFIFKIVVNLVEKQASDINYKA